MRPDKVSGVVLDPNRIPTREKLILAGLYLSKYDFRGLKKLGFQGFTEAFNAIGYALGSKPASVKNYRDEFDPLFPNRRQGWHKRPTREYCVKVLSSYKNLDIESFANLIKSFVAYDESTWSQSEQQDNESQFAKRLITGLAAEQYFVSVMPRLHEFEGYVLENTTRYGCGYDFRLTSQTHKGFLAVEVKGLRDQSGSLALTPKEHSVAGKLKDGFFLFVAKNFHESPTHDIYRNPLSGELQFRRSERRIIQVSWLTTV